MFKNLSEQATSFEWDLTDWEQYIKEPSFTFPSDGDYQVIYKSKRMTQIFVTQLLIQ
jgi:hypothetical protein